MTDRQANYWRWAGRILILLAGLGGILAAAKQLPGWIQGYAALGAALLGYASRWCEQQLPAAKPRAPVAAVLLLLAATLMLSAGCKMSTHDVAVQMVRAQQQARAVTGAQLGASMRLGHLACKSKHGARTPEFAACVKPYLAAQNSWRKYIRPSADTTAQAGLTVLRTKAIVDKCKREKNCDKVVLAILKPGACAIMRGLRAWGHLLSDKGAAVLSALGMFEGVTCGD